MGDLNRKYSDHEVLEGLKEIDGMELEVTGWESNFIDCLFQNQGRPLTNKQYQSAMRILDKYEGEYLWQTWSTRSVKALSTSPLQRS